MIVVVFENEEPQIDAERRSIDSNFQRSFEVYPENNSNRSPQRAQRIAKIIVRSALNYENVIPSRLRTRMTRVKRIFTDISNPCVSVPSVKSVFYLNNTLNHISAFIMPIPCRFSTPRPRMPCGAYVYTPSGGVTLGVHLRLINRAGGA